MTHISDQNVECPVCHKHTLHTDLDIHTNERFITCESCAFYSETKIVVEGSRQFWQWTQHIPMDEDGKVQWPETNREFKVN